MMTIKGRGASYNPHNQFERLEIHFDEDLSEEQAPAVPTQVFLDKSQAILAKNDSPDVPFAYSINPYRGCEHGCIYCYARPSHEYLGFSAGLDFESKIMIKPDAPQLLEKTFRRKSWVPQVVAFSGNTDPYQPIEKKLRLTRECLKVFLKFRNPVGLITKNFLVTRDLDILKELATLNLVHVTMSITTLKADLARKMEPRASAPAKRLEAVEVLARNNVPVGVNAAPIIPGLTDEELPSILRESAARGAKTASYIMVRLPGEVKNLFQEWLRREFPLSADKILHRIREVRDGRLNDPSFGSRMKGEGELANFIQQIFDVHCKKYHLNDERIPLSTESFCRNPYEAGEFTLT